MAQRVRVRTVEIAEVKEWDLGKEEVARVAVRMGKVAAKGEDIKDNAGGVGRWATRRRNAQPTSWRRRSARSATTRSEAFGRWVVLRRWQT